MIAGHARASSTLAINSKIVPGRKRSVVTRRPITTYKSGITTFLNGNITAFSKNNLKLSSCKTTIEMLVFANTAFNRHLRCGRKTK